MSLQKQLLNSAVKSVGERQIKVIISDATQDRAEDIIDPAGIDVSAYLKNPVVLYQHDHDHPIAKCVALNLEGGKWVATVQFPAEEDGIEKSNEVYKLIKAGILNAASIGFIPKEYVWLEDSRWGRKFTSVEMIEFSIVSVPCNPNALITERTLPKDAKGGTAEPHEITAEQALDFLEKAGRVISSANEAKLRNAHAEIGEVLAQVEESTPSKALLTAQVDLLRLKALV